MKEALKPKIKELSALINAYAKDKKSASLVDVATYLASFFDAQTVNFWTVDSKNELIKRIDTDKETVLSLEASLMQRAIDSKEILIENHVTSDKYYNQVIDNPQELKIKALMVLPIIKGKNVVAIVKIWRGIRQRKVFAKKDEEALYAFVPILLKMFEAEDISKEDLLQLLGADSESKPKKVNKTVSSTKKSVERQSTENEAIENLEKEIAKLREENQLYREKDKLQQKESVAYKKSIKMLASIEEKLKKKEDMLLEANDKLKILEKSYKALEKSKKESKNKENELVFQTKIDKYDKELADSKVKYKELEVSSLELYTESQQYQSMIKELKKDLQLIQKENVELNKSLKEKSSTKSIKELKSEKSLLSQSKAGDVDSNIEFILQRVDNKFAENEHAYMLFELMTYALSSKKGIAYIEEMIEKSKLVQQIMDGYYFKGDVQIHNEKYRIVDMVKHIEGYEKNIFAKMVKFNITVDETMPSSLVFDASKMQSIILHLLIDLHQFIDHNQDVNVHLNFKKKFLHIEIGGTIHQQNSLFKKMFKQTKLGGDEKDRIGLQLSKKVIARLKGEIDTVYEDAYYKFIVTVPTQVIKM